MGVESLANKYRPHSWDDVVEQGSAKIILSQQISSGEIKHAYLFVGSQGVGKTTIARIFANEINHGKGNPMEIDAASYNSVDDVRNIIQQAKTKSIDSEYRVWIIDECHALSNNAWQAFLKILEEPPKNVVFIFCTTDSQKIPKTIVSRVQQFKFKRISQTGIKNRLEDICDAENRELGNGGIKYNAFGLEYIAKISEGGMRDAITLLDKCLAFSPELTLENVIEALGTVDYEVFFDLADAINSKDSALTIQTVEKVHADGKDLKQFVRDFMGFLLDVNKYDILHNFDYLQMPMTYENEMSHADSKWFDTCRRLLPVVVKLNADLKWETQPKVVIETRLLGETL